MKLKYTLEELTILRDIRARSFNDDFMDDRYGSDECFFRTETDVFLDWLKKMESQGKIKYLLESYKDTLEYIRQVEELEEIWRNRKKKVENI